MTFLSKFRFKFSRRYRTDPWYQFVFFRFTQRDKPARRRRLNFYKPLIVNRVNSLNRRRLKIFRAFFPWLRSYRFPRHNRFRFRRPTTYGRRFALKQIFKAYYYSLKEKKFSMALRSERRNNRLDIPNSSLNLIRKSRVLINLESRLCSLLSRSKLFITPAEAYYWICSGHIYVDGKKVSKPSFQLYPGSFINFSFFLKEKLMVRTARWFSFFQSYILFNWFLTRSRHIFINFNSMFIVYPAVSGLSYSVFPFTPGVSQLGAYYKG